MDITNWRASRLRQWITLVILAWSAVTTTQSAALPGELLYNVRSAYAIPGSSQLNSFQAGPGFGLDLIYPTQWPNLFWFGSLDYIHYHYAYNDLSYLKQLSLGAGMEYQIPKLFFTTPFVGISLHYSYFLLNLEDSQQQAAAYKPSLSMHAALQSEIYSGLWLRFGAQAFIQELSGSLFTGYQLQASVVMHLSGLFAGNFLSRKESLIRISKTELQPLFLAQAQNYAADGVGSITLENHGRYELHDIKIETTIQEISEQSAAAKNVPVLRPGEKIKVKVPVRTSNRSMALTEIRDLPITFRISYRDKSSIYSYKENDHITVYPKSAISWQNTRHIGSFITPNDSAVVRLVQTALQFRGKDKRHGSLPESIQTAAYLFETLRQNGISYKKDANTSYWNRGDKRMIDHLQFPRTTLDLGAGDCDDLTALLASLYEASGLETAIATTPGHIFLLVQTGIVVDNSRSLPIAKEMVVLNHTLWLPIETTALQTDFFQAWKQAASLISRYKDSGLEIISTSEILKQFPPVDLQESTHAGLPSKPVQAPQEKAIQALFAKILQETQGEKIEKIQSAADQNIATNSELNLLGILYSQSGKNEQSRKIFEQLRAKHPDSPELLINLGHLSLLDREFSRTETLYLRVLQVSPENEFALLSLAQLYHEKGENEKAATIYVQLTKKHPHYLTRYNYLTAAPQQRSTSQVRADLAYQLIWQPLPEMIKPVTLHNRQNSAKKLEK